MSDLSAHLKDEIADLIGGNGAPTAVSNVYIQLHTGAPGSAGTSNVAGESTRKEATFGAASSGVVTLSATVSWTTVASTEVYTHYSLWDASTNGNCLLVDALNSSVSVDANDDFDLTSLTVTAS